MKPLLFSATVVTAITVACVISRTDSRDSAVVTGPRSEAALARHSTEVPKFQVPSLPGRVDQDSQTDSHVAELATINSGTERAEAVVDQSPQVADDWDVADRSHWAFQPLKRPAIPSSHVSSSTGNPIDAFLLVKLQESGIAPAAPSDSATLLRRLTFAATGLPPSVGQFDQYVSGSTRGEIKPAEWSALVKRLLDSPAFGEHQARFWLDLVRYADTNGYEDDGRKPFAWKYRDFVIRAFNRDIPYDQFVQLQIAGDLVAAESNDQSNSDDAFVACGFLRLGAWDSEPNDELRAHYDQVDDIVSTTSLALMGLSVGCARCHDHPLEPISRHDYARMVAVFHGLARPTNGRLEEPLPSATLEEQRRAATIRQEQADLQRQALETENITQAAALRRKARSLEAQVRFDFAYRFAETETSRLPTQLLLRGNPYQPAEYVSAGVPSVLQQSNDDILPAGENLPRLQFARWLTNGGRHLIARVIVNRVWQWHFGHGLSRTISNLGVSGEAPTHPELLEWLAHWFVLDAKWSMKRLHHLILTSDAFRRCSEPESGDSSSRRILFGSFAPRPLRAEMLHDAMLDIAGLRSEELFGPPVEHDCSSEMPSEPAQDAGRTSHRDGVRRAIYQCVQRNQPDPLLQAFGFPDSSVSCEQRTTSYTSEQALSLWNSRFATHCAEALAKRIASLAPDGDSADRRVALAFQFVLGRSADASEMNAMGDFLKARSHDESTDTESRLTQLCLVLFNLDEFAILD